MEARVSALEAALEKHPPVAKDLDISELEIAFEEKGQLEGFEAEYGRLFNKEWSSEKGKVAFALSEASRV